MLYFDTKPSHPQIAKQRSMKVQITLTHSIIPYSSKKILKRFLRMVYAFRILLKNLGQRSHGDAPGPVADEVKQR